MKSHPPLRMAIAVPVLYAFLAVFFLNGDPRDPKREYFAATKISSRAANPAPDPASPVDEAITPGASLSEGGQHLPDPAASTIHPR